MRLFFIVLLHFIFFTTAFSMEKVFYVLHDHKQEALSAIAKNSHLTDLLIVQAYQIDYNGGVSGSLDEDVLNFSYKHSIKLMALVTNRWFDANKVHQFLANLTAQQKALKIILDESKKNHIAGVQFDFEMVPLKDKDALTQFYQSAADLLHKNGFIVSFAIAPTLTDKNFTSLFQKKLYYVWQGAYDFKKLGELSDFVTIMSYDQHGSGTPPGPIASIPWNEKVIQHAIKFIPENKISLGIPTYSGLWYMRINPFSYKTSIQYNSLDNKTLIYILKKYRPDVQWDNFSQVHYTFYQLQGINRIIFIEDGKSFEAKYDLAKKYRLRGISVFRLGIEDPTIWDAFTDKSWWEQFKCSVKHLLSIYSTHKS